MDKNIEGKSINCPFCSTEGNCEDTSIDEIIKCQPEGCQFSKTEDDESHDLYEIPIPNCKSYKFIEVNIAKAVFSKKPKDR